MPNKFYSLPKSVFENYHAKIKDWVRAILPTKTSDLTNDSDFFDQLALAGIIAVTFSASSTYKVGDYVLYNHTLYRCKTAITTAGAWDASKWDAAKTQDIFKGSAPGLVPSATAGTDERFLAPNGSWVPIDIASEEDIDKMFYQVTIGGRDYKYIKIGNQLWLAEDLKLTWTELQYTDGGGWIDSQSYTTYSEYPTEIYYNYHAVNDLMNNHSDLLPDGWHVPSESEFQTLMNNSTHLALKSTTGWNPAGTNVSGFNMYPVGGYNGSAYDSSNGTDIRTTDSSRYLRLENASPGIRFVTWNTNYKKYNPVRLVKNVT